MRLKEVKFHWFKQLVLRVICVTTIDELVRANLTVTVVFSPNARIVRV